MTELAPFLGGFALAALAGPLGCFVVWRQMAYFGDALAHSALLGVALGILSGIDDKYTILLVGCAFVIGLLWLEAYRILAVDTLLGILAHSALAFGVIGMTLLGADEIDLHDYFFGSIEALSPMSAMGLMIGAGIGLLILWRMWQGLLLLVSDSDIAASENIPVLRYNFILMILMTLTVALAVHVVGILLVTSLLIIPAATARFYAHSPLQMAILSSSFAILAISIGLGLDEYERFANLNLDSGPVIIVLLLALFLISLIYHRLAIWRGKLN